MRRNRATRISTTKGRATRNQETSNRMVLMSGRQRKRPQRIKQKRPQKGMVLISGRQRKRPQRIKQKRPQKVKRPHIKILKLL
jgi:hypothetical protein